MSYRPARKAFDAVGTGYKSYLTPRPAPGHFAPNAPPFSPRSPSGSSQYPPPAPRVIRAARPRPSAVPHLLTLADLSPAQISALLTSALTFKTICKTFHPSQVRKSLASRNVAMMFTKRSTRTRVASETATSILGGQPMFLGAQDIQLGVNESLEDTAKVVGSMVDGMMARVGDHSEVEELAKHSPVPVINALSHLYHPTQILADLLTLHETYASPPEPLLEFSHTKNRLFQELLAKVSREIDPLASFKGKKVAWVGDLNNITNEMIVTMPRLGMRLAIAAPKGYDQVDPKVWQRVEQANTASLISITNTPSDALADADVVVTDTWISMGQEAEKAERLAAFSGYQITNSLVESAKAKPDWKFMHCLPRHSEEVDDEVFYGPRSLVFPEAENRKWTIMACFDALFGQWRIHGGAESD